MWGLNDAEAAAGCGRCVDVKTGEREPGMSLKRNHSFFAGVGVGVCTTIAVFYVVQVLAPIWFPNVKVAAAITGIAMLLMARLFRGPDFGVSHDEKLRSANERKTVGMGQRRRPF
jgi:hypothetical protein